MWSRIGTHAASIFSLSFRGSYATPQSEITSYRSSDSGGFALFCLDLSSLMLSGKTTCSQQHAEFCRWFQSYYEGII